MTAHPAITVAASPTAVSISSVSVEDAAIAWGGVALCLSVAAGLLLLVRRQLNGKHRRWVVAPPIPFQISKRNTWPFMLIGFAGFWVMTAVATVFEALGNEAGRQFIWSWPAYVPWPLEEAVRALSDAPDHRAQQKLVGDIGWSGQDPEMAWELTGLAGPVPETRFDERTRELKRELAQRKADRG